MRRSPVRFRLCICLAVAALTGGHAVSSRAVDGWTSFRGPTDQGLASDADLPVRWSEQDNVVWKTAIRGKAWSSPVIWGDKIWLTNANEEGTRLSVLCVDKKTGRIVTEKVIRTVVAPQYCHPFNSYASPSPVVEPGRLYVSFGAPCTACLDLETGEVLWMRTDFVCNHFRGPGSSPFLFENLLILHFDGSDAQYVVAMDKTTGKTVWQTKRSVDYQDLDPSTGQPAREGDFRKAFSTPIITHVNDQPLLISLGSMAVYGYDPATGEERWRAELIGSHSGSCRPVAGHGLVFVPMGIRGQLWAIRPDGRGDVTDTHVVWKYRRAVPERSSPLLVDDWLFVVTTGGVAACLDARSGRELGMKRLGGNHSASPIYASGRVYFFDEDGKATVIAAAPEFEVLATNQLDDGFMASPAVSGNALYLRTRSHLYRIEEKSD